MTLIPTIAHADFTSKCRLCGRSPTMASAGAGWSQIPAVGLIVAPAQLVISRARRTTEAWGAISCEVDMNCRWRNSENFRGPFLRRTLRRQIFDVTLAPRRPRRVSHLPEDAQPPGFAPRALKAEDCFIGRKFSYGTPAVKTESTLERHLPPFGSFPSDPVQDNPPLCSGE